MPYVKRTTSFDRFRILISGLSNSGKTTSLATFIYGPYDYRDPEQEAEAKAYAGNKHMVVLVCPGETGYRTLPPDSPNLTSYYIETGDSEDTTSATWSAHHIQEFLNLSAEIRRNKPDALFWDGIHWLYNHDMNKNSEGEFLQGTDMDIDPTTGRAVQYRAAKFYNRTRREFGQYLASYYTSTIPLFGCTVWEKWEEVASDQDRPDVKNKRYLWPDISGEMATKVVGVFDARVSARIEKFCLDPTCEYKKARQDHYVWQFLPGGDVMGVGIKGLRVNRAMLRNPWIHQNWDDLQQLMATFS